MPAADMDVDGIWRSHFVQTCRDYSAGLGDSKGGSRDENVEIMRDVGGVRPWSDCSPDSVPSGKMVEWLLELLAG